jgi:Uma2 family endonuclease
MSALLKQKPRFNVAAFAEYVRPFPAHERWELLAGEAVLMAPQGERHQRIVANLMARIGRLARQRGCREFPGLAILDDRIDDYAPITDVVVRCGPPQDSGYITDPKLVAEVLSSSTAANDRGRKLEFYKGVPGLETILLVYQKERRIEHWTWDGNGWREGVTQSDGAVPLAAVDGEMTLDEAYEDLD